MQKNAMQAQLKQLRAELHSLATDLRTELRSIATSLGLSLQKDLSPEQAGLVLGVSTRTVWRMIAAKELRTVWVHGRQKVPMAEIDRYSSTKASSVYRRRPREVADAILAELRAESRPRKKRTTGIDAVGSTRSK